MKATNITNNPIAIKLAENKKRAVDYCVHADTTWEHQHTYRFAKQWQPWLESCGIKVITVKADDTNVAYAVVTPEKSYKYTNLPLYSGRNDCINWLTAHGLQVPGKSSCVFCPYHNSGAWRELKRQNGPDWEDAVAVDEAIRYIRPPYPLFVHRSRVPLREAVVIPEDFGAEQGNLFNLDDVPCDSGVCFL